MIKYLWKESIENVCDKFSPNFDMLNLHNNVHINSNARLSNPKPPKMTFLYWERFGNIFLQKIDKD